MAPMQFLCFYLLGPKVVPVDKHDKIYFPKNHETIKLITGMH